MPLPGCRVRLRAPPAASQLHPNPRRARSHRLPSPCIFSLSLTTHFPPQQRTQLGAVRVFQTFSPSRAFTNRIRRSSHPPAPSIALAPTTSNTSPSSRTRSFLDFLTMGGKGTQTRGHAGHGHHHHHHDNVYLTSTNKNDAGVRITRIGLYSNLGMAIAKGAGGYAFNSQSMIADAWHSLTDLASDVLTLATVSWSLRPPTENFPQGFGKVESLGSLGVSGMLLFGGLFMCMSSCQSLYAHFFLDPAAAAALLEHGHGHSHGHHHHGHGHGSGAPSLHAAWLAAGTVAVKEWLYRATMKVARERKSSVLASNAVHHRVDSLTGIVALLAILGANLLRDATWLDPVGGLFISLLVIRAGFSNTLSALYELADRSIDEEVRASISKQVGKALREVQVQPERLSSGAGGGVDGGEEVELRDVTGVKSGQNYLVDLELAVPALWTVEDVRAVEEAVRTRVGAKVRGVRRVRVRFVPKTAVPVESDRFDEFIPGDVSPRTSPEPEEEDGNGNGDHHGHGHDHGHRKSD